MLHKSYIRIARRKFEDITEKYEKNTSEVTSIEWNLPLGQCKVRSAVSL